MPFLRTLSKILKMTKPKIQFTNHARQKTSILERHGFRITEADIINVLERPESTRVGHSNREIAQAPIDERHVLRVVYEKDGETKRVITFYPSRRERYEKSRL